MQGHVSAAPDFEGYVCYFGSLHPAFEMSCETEYLGKNSFWFFRKRGLSRFGLCFIFLKVSVQIFGKCRPMSPNQLTFLLKWRSGQPKVFALSCVWLVSLIVNEKGVVSSSREECSWINTYFRSTAVLGFACASFRRLRMVLSLFTSCVWDVLRYRILRKTAFDFFGNVVFVVLYCVQLFWWFSYKPSENYWAISPKGKHKLSKTTLSTFQKGLFELWWACWPWL